MKPTPPKTVALRAAVQCVLDVDDLDYSLPRALNLLGRETGVHRLKIFTAGSDGTLGSVHTLTCEWWADGLQSQSSYGLTEFPDDAIRDYISLAREGRQSWETIDTVPTSLREPFECVSMRSMGVTPLVSFGRYWGLLAVDDCERRRTTPMVDMDALGIFGRTIGAALHRHRTSTSTANASRIPARNELVTFTAPDMGRRIDRDIAKIETQINDSVGLGEIADRIRFVPEALRSTLESDLKASERQRIAGEIHDGLAQAFIAILLQSRAAGSASATGVADAAVTALSRIHALATDGLADSRRVTAELRAAAVDRSGLLPALSDLADRCTITGQTECRFRAEGEFATVSEELEHSVYRIAQEGIQNAMRHASAQTVNVDLRRAETSLILIVEDDGVGISGKRDAGSAWVVPHSISERALRCGGTAQVEPRSPTGTRVRVDLPLSPLAPITDLP